MVAAYLSFKFASQTALDPTPMPMGMLETHATPMQWAGICAVPVLCGLLAMIWRDRWTKARQVRLVATAVLALFHLSMAVFWIIGGGWSPMAYLALGYMAFKLLVLEKNRV